jgi:hypothetical protein
VGAVVQIRRADGGDRRFLARRLYRRLSFEEVAMVNGSITMRLDL